MIRGIATRLLLALVVLLGTGAPAAFAQDTGARAVPGARPEGIEVGPTIERSVAAATAADEGAVGDESVAGEDGRLSTAVEIALLLTVLSLLPAVLISLTSFTRIVIVLSFVRRAMSLNELPPNPVIIGLALFLTMFVMAPVGESLHDDAWVPYEGGEIELEEATSRAWSTLATFLVTNTREGELALFAELAGENQVFAAVQGRDGEGGPGSELQGGTGAGFQIAPDVDPADLPLTVVVPAFILSELKTAFQMGFLLFLPFLVIDLVVASVLLSMGMFMLPPAMISTPIKVLIFVLVDGWRLVTESVVSSFITGA